MNGLDIDKLARLNLTGGNIRNIALNSTFLAKQDNGPVKMSHLWQAIRSEYSKLGKELNRDDIDD